MYRKSIPKQAPHHHVGHQSNNGVWTPPPSERFKTTTTCPPPAPPPRRSTPYLERPPPSQQHPNQMVIVSPPGQMLEGQARTTTPRVSTKKILPCNPYTKKRNPQQQIVDLTVDVSASVITTNRPYSGPSKRQLGLEDWQQPWFYHCEQDRYLAENKQQRMMQVNKKQPALPSSIVVSPPSASSAKNAAEDDDRKRPAIKNY